MNNEVTPEMIEAGARAIAVAAIGSDEAWLLYVPQAEAGYLAMKATRS